MGRSSSCFKIITCGGDSSDKDDPLVSSENKGSSDKRGWSFRKKSASHRVLSNTVISETPSANKESPESTSLNFQPCDNPTIPEKISAIQCADEKPQLSISFDSKASETIIVTKDGNEADTKLEESVVILIQAAVRRFLAQKELLKLKNVVKLQAAVRGHLVRQHAIGTLRCVQAIVKMQALVRARRARLLLEASCMDKKSDVINNKKVNSAAKPNVTYSSIEKLRSNSFARQLMESTPKTKPIHIKCDPSKPNSAWIWLERWMAISSAESSPNPELRTKQLEEVKNDQLETLKNEICASPSEITVSCKGFSESRDSKSDAEEAALPSEIEENLITYDADNLMFLGDDLEPPKTEKISTSDAKETSTDINSLPSQSTWFAENSQLVLNSVPHKPETESEKHDEPKRSMKRLASEQLENEGKILLSRSRKASNPAFIAAQSKFEKLSSTNDSRSLSPLQQDSGVESNMDVVSSVADVTRTKEFELAENLIPHKLRAQYGGSECGTELSITSTLDSPDTFELGAAEYGQGAKVLEEETRNADNEKDIDEAKGASTFPLSDVSTSLVDHAEKFDSDKDESTNSMVAADFPHVELNVERSTSDFRREFDSQVGCGPAYKSSSEASPRSRTTFPESHGTPSSQVSVNAKKNKREKSGSNKKRVVLSAEKRSPSNTDQNSGGRSNMEQNPKDQKNGKKRNSFGSTGPEYTDQEPRDSNSSTSVPHFMQATESARAKINANNSPRSSPDVQDRDYIKKRHSLPGANGRQGSPRLQQSVSQGQHAAKGNGSHVVHEKKWQR